MWAAWQPGLWTTLPLAVLAMAYLRGRRGLPARFGRWRAAAFLAGLASLWAALESPIDAAARYALWPHMLQHVLLSLVAAPLIVLGMPGIPLLRGSPRWLREAIGALLAMPAARRALRGVAHPLAAGTLFSLAMWIWHAPRLYQLAIEDPFWHAVEHACFLLTAMLLWWNVFEPAPFRSAWGPLPRVLLLLAIDLQNTVFCAVLAFAGRPLYPIYEATAPILGVTPLHDQQAAAGIMWFASQSTLLPAAGVLVAAAVRRRGRREQAAAPRRAVPRRIADRGSLAELLLLPALRSRRFRDGVRWSLFVAMAVVVLDGFLGPSDAPANLAGTLPWTHGRGLLVIGILLAGNIACMGCPFMAPRGLMRRFVSPTRSFPKALRSKWLAAALVALWLAFYEAFDLWASPYATAWVLVGYVAALLLVDGLFAGASFCKWVCPLGQLHGSLGEAAPVQVGVADPAVCGRCTTMECIRGTAPRPAAGGAVLASLPVLSHPPRAAAAIPGCELHLAQPLKRGNTDCTFCMDCSHACPHGNVTILAKPVVADLALDAPRSGVGRISSRPDLALLMGVLTFGAFANALGMTVPAAAAMEAIRTSLGLADDRLVAFVGTLLFAVGLPAGLGLLAAGGSRERFCLGLRGLLPIGGAMWAVHFGFHLVTGFGAGWASLQRAAGDVGIDLGEPQWAAACCAAAPPWLVPAELLALQVGAVVSAAALARSLGRAAWPWIALVAALMLLGFWIVSVPMDMRGAVG